MGGEKMLFSEIERKEVLDVNANRVGNIIDVDLDVNKGTINHFMIKIGVFKKVPLTPEKIDRIGSKVLLKVSRVDLESTPVISK
jgi:sporulation protein YlmC with PRC-barrel domain